MSSSIWRRYSSFSSQEATGSTLVCSYWQLPELKHLCLIKKKWFGTVFLYPSPGPLLYHFSDMPSEFSIELSWEDIRRIAAEEIGFEMLVGFVKDLMELQKKDT